MKVLSIQEPYATLIALGKKKIETRSWKTNYRGELYIHASGKTLSKLAKNNEYLNAVIKNIDMNYGFIICKVNLVDCIYMDEAFIENIKNNNDEYNLGLFEKGRYAWILENATLVNPIFVKGKLNIWEYRK